MKQLDFDIDCDSDDHPHCVVTIPTDQADEAQKRLESAEITVMDNKPVAASTEDGTDKLNLLRLDSDDEEAIRAALESNDDEDPCGTALESN